MEAHLEQIFVKQLKENQNLIHKVCRIYTTSGEEHQDLFQEITIQLWKAFPQFRGEAKFTTWAYRIALNTAITLFRKKKRAIDTIEFNSTTHKIDFEEYNFEEEEQLKLLYKAIHQLGDIEKALVFMYLEDKDYREISETLGISEVNARVKMNRVKTKLKQLVNP
ncbi:MAG: sigma-70 family RNA polymerase sigma factor [Flavobacteriaceae bacterium]